MYNRAERGKLKIQSFLLLHSRYFQMTLLLCGEAETELCTRSPPEGRFNRGLITIKFYTLVRFSHPCFDCSMHTAFNSTLISLRKIKVFYSPINSKFLSLGAKFPFLIPNEPDKRARVGTRVDRYKKLQIPQPGAGDMEPPKATC